MQSQWAIASDHAGIELKRALARQLADSGVQVTDLGTDTAVSVDYPDFAHLLAGWVEAGKDRRGVLICGSGIGMSIAANRHKGVRAALCWSPESAALSRQHNNANVLCLGARLVDEKTARECLTRFMQTPFEGGRHDMRVNKLSSC
jgi:ribose 5-phosphate isomerase B